MTIVLLASVSLFALLVTSRPILPDSDLAPTASTWQTAVQAVFRIHPGQDDLNHDAARFQSQKPKQHITYLSELDAAVASFELSPGVKSSFEELLHQTIDVQDVLDTNNDLDADHVTDEWAPSESVLNSQETPTDDTPGTPLVALAFSCVAAFLALACVALTLYITNRLRFQMVASKRAWALLPHFWTRPKFSENASAAAKDRLLGGDYLLLQTEIEQQQRLLHAEEGFTERHDLHTADKHLCVDSTSDMESEGDDVDEKYQDALDMMPLPSAHNLPLEQHAPHHLGYPPMPSSDSAHPLDQPRNDDRSTPLMREVCRPAWSVRAIDAPALGLPSREYGGVDATPQPLLHPRRRAYHSVMPDFDIALAMQLRPGLGIGADSAWMVRFLMTIFGWFAVALTGNSARP